VHIAGNIETVEILIRKEEELIIFLSLIPFHLNYLFLKKTKTKPRTVKV